MPRFAIFLAAVAMIAGSHPGLSEEPVEPLPYFGAPCHHPHFPGSAGQKPKKMSYVDELHERERQTKDPFTVLETRHPRLILFPNREMHGVVRGHPNGTEQKVIVKILMISRRCGRIDGRMTWPDLGASTVIKGVMGDDAFVFQEVYQVFPSKAILNCRYRFEPEESGQLKGPVSCPNASGEAILSDVDYYKW